MRNLLGMAVATAILAGAAATNAQDPAAPAGDCCGGKTNVAGADSASGAPVKIVRMRLAPGGDAARTLETLQGLPAVSAATVSADGRSATLSLPTSFAAWGDLERSLGEKGVAATLQDPVHLILKLARGDGKVDFAGLQGSFALAAGLLACEPAAGGAGLSIWADPACVDAQELVGIAEGRGYQASLASHESVEAALLDGFCPSCEGEVRAAAGQAIGALGAVVDYGTYRVRVLAEKGRLTSKDLEKALIQAGFDGQRKDRPEACGSCRNRR